MTIDWPTTDGIGLVILTSAHAADHARLEEFLRSPDLKGVVVRYAVDISGDAGPLADVIRAAAVPVAAMVRADCGGAGLEIASACDFRFESAEALGDADEQAAEFLRALTEGRPAPLVRAIVTSIRNAGRMPLDAALREETDLFCRAARVLISADPEDGPQ